LAFVGGAAAFCVASATERWIAVPPTPLIVDAHNDLLLELEHRRFEEAPFTRG
jgi:hypothetical protein